MDEPRPVSGGRPRLFSSCKQGKGGGCSQSNHGGIPLQGGYYGVFFYECGKQEMEGKETVHRHDAHLGDTLVFKDNPFLPGGMQRNMYIAHAILEAASIASIFHGTYTGRKAATDFGTAPLILSRGRNGANFLSASPFNEHIHLRYDFSRIEVHF